MPATERFKGARVAVLMGGQSREREISLKTGGAIASALEERGYTVIPMDVSREIALQLVKENIDVAFIALHGRWGEDGTIQGLLEILHIPYTGSGVEASAMAMDKVVSKRLFREAGLPTPGFHVLQSPMEAPPGPLPLVVKPVMEGSTLGINIVRAEEMWLPAMEEAFRYDQTILVEDFIEGREITASILNGEPLPLIHIEPKEGFYDFQAKYTPGKTLYHVPAALDADVTVRVKALSLQAYETLGCAGCARVDLILSDEVGPMLLEVNTIPGMTPTSLVPKAAKTAGLSFGDLVGAILDAASLKISPYRDR